MPFLSRFYNLFSKSFIKLSHSQGFISALEFFRIGHSACKNQTVKVRFIDYGCTTLTKTRRRFVVEFFIFIINMHCKHSAVIHNWCSEYIPLILTPKNKAGGNLKNSPLLLKVKNQANVNRRKSLYFYTPEKSQVVNLST